MCIITNVTGDSSFKDVIHSIDLCCFKEESWSKELIEKELSKSETHYLLCSSENQYVAYLSFSSILGDVNLDRIAVLPEFQGRGVGYKFMNEFINLVKKQGNNSVFLEVRSGNESALNLYKKCNFKIDCIRKKYYQNPSENAVLMSLKL